MSPFYWRCNETLQLAGPLAKPAFNYVAILLAM